MSHALAIAGISGFTGRRVLPLLEGPEAKGATSRLLLRKKTAATAPWSGDPRVVGVDLLDETALAIALAGVDTLVCLVGTTRAQFRPATTTEPEVSYETVDIGIPRAMARAGANVGAKRFV
ncbi:MAG: NAD(P)H-binding protein, partial [Polyangiales bacterium]